MTFASIISVCAPGVAGVSIGFTIPQWPRAGSQAAMLLRIREGKAGLGFPSRLGHVEESSPLTTAGLPAQQGQHGWLSLGQLHSWLPGRAEDPPVIQDGPWIPTWIFQRC